MKAALLQLCATQNKENNIARALGLAQEALTRGARFVLLPEMFNFRGDTRNKRVLQKAAEEISGPSTQEFISLARQYKASFLMGSIIEKTDGPSVYNTSVFIDPLGKVTAKYRKIHLFDALIDGKIIKESGCFRPGRKLVTAKMGEWRIGLSVCYDLRFPKLYQDYARQGAEVLAVPSSFTRKTGEAHWEVLLRARAIENLAYVLAPAQVGVDARGVKTHGHSMIVSPWGEIVAEGSGDKEEIVFGEIDRGEVCKARKTLPRRDFGNNF